VISDAPTLLGASMNWSDMVANDAANGSADLPVIDFAELGDQSFESPAAQLPPARLRKPARAPKVPKAARRPPLARTASAPASAPSPSAPTSDPAMSDDENPMEPGPKRGSFFQRKSGQTARQAYQERLESDPRTYPLLVSSGVMMIGCWRRTCAALAAGGEDAGRVEVVGGDLCVDVAGLSDHYLTALLLQGMTIQRTSILWRFLRRASLDS